MTQPLPRWSGLGLENLGGKNQTTGPYDVGAEMPPTPPIYVCAHCDRYIDNGGKASFNGENLCYPEGDDMNCYDLVAHKGHPMPCLLCFASQVTKADGL